MEEKLGRVFKRFVAFMCAFVVFVFGVCLTSFHSYASSNFDFVYNSAEPSCSEGQGYLVLLMHNGNNYSTRLYSFMSSSVNSSGAYMPTASNISITSNRVVFNLQTNAAAVSGFHAVYYIAQNGNMSLVGATDSDTIDITPTGGEIISWQVYGNGYVSSNTQNSSQTWSISFRGGDAINQFAVDMSNALSELVFSNGENSSVIIDTLSDMKEYLYQVQNDVGVSTDYLLSICDYCYEIMEWLPTISDHLYGLESYFADLLDIYLPDIYDQLDSIGKKIDKSNTWLEKIWNSIQEFLGLESNEEMEPLPDEDVGSVIEGEDSLMQDTTDAENSLDFSVDSDSNNVVWNIIERVLNSNSKVFGAFIGIMTLGVITLLLNR